MRNKIKANSRMRSARKKELVIVYLSITWYPFILYDLIRRNCSLSEIFKELIYLHDRLFFITYPHLFPTLNYLHTSAHIEYFKIFIWFRLLTICASNLFSDHWFVKCVYTSAYTRRISRCLSRYGAYGCKLMSSHTNGSWSWANVLFALSDALRNQAFTLGWNHT